VEEHDANPRRDLSEGGRYVLGDAYLRPLLLGHALANSASGSCGRSRSFTPSGS
jgi:hypothetical protein